MAFTIDMFSPFISGWTGGLGGPNSGGHTGSNWFIKYGMDLGVKAGTFVYAAFAGHVTKFQPHVPAKDTSKVYGAQLFMRSDNDMMGAFYTHFTGASLKVSQRIEMGDYLGATLRDHLHIALVEIIGGAPNGRYMGIDIYRDFVALRDSDKIIKVTFHQNGSPPTVSY
jgi:Peptidase family M23